MNKTLVFCLVLLALGLSSVECAKRYNPNYSHKLDKEKLQTALAQTSYCYGDVDVNMDADFCFNFAANCSECFSFDYYTKCIFQCGGGADCNCNSDYSSYCLNLVDVCTTCWTKWQSCQCPSGTSLVVHADQTRTCEFDACPFGSIRMNSLCTDCTACDVSCFGCADQPDNCVNCADGYCNAPSNGGFTNVCVPASAQCQVGTWKYINADGCFDCFDLCPAGYWGNPESGNCEPCSTGCLTCAGGPSSNCVCEDNWCSFQDTCVPSDFQCPDGTFKLDSWTGVCFDCVTCDGCPLNSWCDPVIPSCSNDCSYPNFIFNYDCIPQCPSVDGEQLYQLTIENTDPVMYNCVPCAGCPSACDPNSFTCIQCDAPNFVVNNLCVAHCPAPYVQVVNTDGSISCLDTCPTGWFQYTDTDGNLNCGQCDPSCKNCVGDAFSCTFPCPDTLIWYKSTCVPQCPDGYFSYGYTDSQYSKCDYGDSCICGKCDPSCETCVGGQSDQCVTCPYGFFLTPQGTCVSTCQVGQYPSSDGIHCYCCNDACSGCYGGQVDECSECQPGFQLIGSTCFELNVQAP